MKKIITCFALILLCSLTNNSFAQRESGGSADGSTVPPQPCPVNFVRNNGDGTCGGQSQIRLYFSQVPSYAPTLENILYNGEPLLTNAFPINANISELATKGYLSYCLPTSNIPPAIKLTIVLRYRNSIQDDCVLSGTN